MSCTRGIFAGLVLSSGLLGTFSPMSSVDSAWAIELKKQIPDEYESTGGHGLALSNAGYAANEPHAAIRANPALMPMDRSYSISGGYHWPVGGREYFQASVVDAKTSAIAAGVSYTGYMEDYRYAKDLSGEAQQRALLDSPVVRRGTVAFGQNFGALAVGAGAGYVEANPVRSSEEFKREEKRVKGIGLNLGAAVNLAPQWRAGAAVENASNQRVKDYMPKTYKAGLAYLVNNNLSGFLDYRQRDRVLEFEGDMTGDEREDRLMKQPEQLVLASFSAQLQDYLRLIGSYGSALTDDRRTASGGAAIVNKGFSISYTLSRPYMKHNATHQAVSLSVDMAM